jgi:transposase-like protein
VFKSATAAEASTHGVTSIPKSFAAVSKILQRQALADRDACDRLLKAIFDRGLGQRQIARVTGIPLSTVQRALQRVGGTSFG